MEAYKRFLFQFVKWWSFAAIGIAVVILLCILADWFEGAGWGYPWWSLPFILVFIGIAFVIGRVGAPASIPNAELGRFRAAR